MNVLTALCLLAAVTGIWVSRSGRPLKKLPSAIHKLVATGLLVLAIWIFGDGSFGALPVIQQVAGIVGLAAMVSLFATGAVLSGKDRKRPLVALHIIGTVVVVITGFILTQPVKVSLPNQVPSLNYHISESSIYTKSVWDEKSGIHDEINLYDAGRNQLSKFDLIKYWKSFVSIDDAQTAAQAAAYVHEEIYGAPSGDYVVRYNENAKAWIVYDELPATAAGGCGVFAITEEAGEVIMGYHGK